MCGIFLMNWKFRWNTTTTAENDFSINFFFFGFKWNFNEVGMG